MAAAQDTLTLSCPVCHAPANVPSAIPSLEGLAADRIEQDLRAYREGTREGSAMPRLAAALTDAEIRRLAERYGFAAP